MRQIKAIKILIYKLRGSEAVNLHQCLRKSRMKLSLFAALFRNIGLAIASILLSIELAIVYPLPTAIYSIAQTEPTSLIETTATPSPQTSTIKKDSQKTPQIDLPPKNPNPTAKPTPKQEQNKSGGPYDLKAIQESYKSLYGS